MGGREVGRWGVAHVPADSKTFPPTAFVLPTPTDTVPAALPKAAPVSHSTQAEDAAQRLEGRVNRTLS
jgi:hypothetical protein